MRKRPRNWEEGVKGMTTYGGQGILVVGLLAKISI